MLNLVRAQGSILTETANLRKQTQRIEEETTKMKQKAEELRQLKRDNENQVLDEKMAAIKAKAEDLKRAKDRRKKGLKEEQPELKIVEDKTGMSAYEAALYDIKDPLVPVQGHGLIELTKLVNSKDPETIERMDTVMGIFQASLEDEDTYIYLSAITGLVGCGRQRPEPVLDTLTREFGAVATRPNLAEDKVMEVKTKVGEALVQVTRELGELTPKYKNLLINAFFGTANDPDVLIRASSLSNLGELCKLLRFSLGHVTGELMMHLEASARDPAPEVRRAAAMVLTMMLEGLGQDALVVLDTCLKEIHR